MGRKRCAGTRLSHPPIPRPPSVTRSTTWLLLLVLAVGIFVRLWQLDARGLGHPENNTPLVRAPAWAEQPTPRTSLGTVLRANLRDGHPPLWFLAMYCWSSLTGTSLWALRLPSVLAGVASLLLLFLVARRLVGPPTAACATALLALSGFHVYWSQVARMYAAAGAVGLGSTLLLLRLCERPGRGRGLAYAVVAAAGLWTQIYTWPLLLAQMLWALLATPRAARATVLSWQLLAVVLGTPLVALALYQNPGTAWRESPFEFLALGYAFCAEMPFFVTIPPVPVPRLVLGVLTVGLLVFGLRRRATALPETAAAGTVPPLLLVAGVLIMAAGIAAFACLAPPRATITSSRLLAMALLPVLVAGLALTTSRWVRYAPHLPQLRLDVVLALLPVTLMALVALVRPLFVARGTVLFVPYLMIGVAAGLTRLRPPLLRVAVLAPTLALLVCSLCYHAHAQSSSKDYQGMARALAAQFRAGDLLFVQNNYRYTPLYYHLTIPFEQVVHRDFDQARARAPNARIWVLVVNDVEGEPLLDHVRDCSRVARIDVSGLSARAFIAGAR